jgi:cysteine sulfinate desulfinase/cysteine desulfurase-like protein
MRERESDILLIIIHMCSVCDAGKIPGALYAMAVTFAKVSLHMITGPGGKSFLMIGGSFML